MNTQVAITREAMQIVCPAALSAGQPFGIALDEWLEFVANSWVLVLVEAHETQNAFLRLAHPVRRLDGRGGWLFWTAGEIWASEPDPVLLETMILVAVELGARVRNGRGEFYRCVNERYRATSAKSPIPACKQSFAAPPAKPYKKSYSVPNNVLKVLACALAFLCAVLIIWLG